MELCPRVHDAWLINGCIAGRHGAGMCKHGKRTGLCFGDIAMHYQDLYKRKTYASSTALDEIVSCKYLGSIIHVCGPDQQLSVFSQAEQDITQAEQLNDASAVASVGANPAIDICTNSIEPNVMHDSAPDDKPHMNHLWTL